MSALVGMGWHPMWSTFVGCLKGCLDYVGFEDSAAWIYGGTGHAFVLNVHPELCPSGPTAWNTRTMHRLAANVGADLRGIVGFRKDPRIAALREQAWEAVKGAIAAEVAYIKEVTGSGKPFAAGAGSAPERKPRTAEEAAADWNRILNEVGMPYLAGGKNA